MIFSGARANVTQCTQMVLSTFTISRPWRIIHNGIDKIETSSWYKINVTLEHTLNYMLSITNARTRYNMNVNTSTNLIYCITLNWLLNEILITRNIHPTTGICPIWNLLLKPRYIFIYILHNVDGQAPLLKKKRTNGMILTKQGHVWFPFLSSLILNNSLISF